MAKCRKKVVMGIPCTSPDGAVWNWEIGQTRYSWCVVGQVRVYNSKGEGRILLHANRIQGAVGYTMGHQDGYMMAMRGMQKPADGETAPSVASS